MSSLKVLSEVTGTVWKVETTVGAVLSEDDTVVVIESMKMEIPVMAPEGGIVTEVLVKEGEAVTDGQLLAVIEV